MQASKHRILVVEDHDDTRDLVRLILAGCNYDVQTASTFSEAAKLVQARGFSLFIFDSILPDGYGLDLCRQVRQFDKDTPIAFCSGLAYEKDKGQALGAGAQAYLIKPFDSSELVRSVAELIAKAQTSYDRSV
jgi:two-component system, OmpR family, phosphate regulon response regulator PhoB